MTTDVGALNALLFVLSIRRDALSYLTRGDLGARSEGFLIGRTDLGATIERLVAYADAGADCLYAPGIRDLSAISEVVSTVAPKPVNALLLGPEMHVAGLVDAGVRRVSTGGGLAAAAWAGFDNALRLLTEKGTLPKRQ